MKPFIKHIVLSLMLLQFSNVALAQNDLSDSLRFVVHKAYRPVARDARKLLSMPSLSYDTVTPVKVNYSVLPRTSKTAYKAQPLNAAKLSNEPLQKLYSGFAKVGFGNYTMPFLEASFTSLRNKKYQAGGFARYHASYAKQRNRPFGFTDAGINAFAKYFLPHHTLRGRLIYDVDENYYYGYDVADLTIANVSAVSKDSIHQVFHHVGAIIDLKAAQESKLRLFDVAEVGYDYTRDNFSSQEHHAVLLAGAALNVKKEKLFIRTAFNYYNLSMPSATSNNLIWSISPEFKAERKKWAIRIGVDFSLDVNDTATKVLVFPILDFHYFLVPDRIRFYVGAKGGVVQNGLRSISQTNPYFKTDQPLSNSWERLNIKGGFKGSIIRSLGFDVSVAEIITGQQMFFVNDTSDGIGHRFLAEFHDVRTTSFKGALSYSLNEAISLSAAAEYRLFTMPTDSIKPWHEAPFRFTFSGNYDLKDKFIFKAAITANGPRVVRSFTTDLSGVHLTPVTLKGYADVSLGVEYRYRKWIGAFIDFRNIAAMRYELWNQYPSQRFSFIAGLHFSF